MNVEEAKKKKDCHLVCWVNGEDPWIGESGVTRMSVCWKIRHFLCLVEVEVMDPNFTGDK